LSFSLKRETADGKIIIDVNRDISPEDLDQLVQIVERILPPRTKPGCQASLPIEPIGQKISGPSKLGEKPVNEIIWGTYKEPDSGVRIKILHLIQTGRARSVNAMRKISGLPMKSCYEIICGNYKSPIFSEQMARAILKEFEKEGLHATLVQTTKKQFQLESIH